MERLMDPQIGFKWSNIVMISGPVLGVIIGAIGAFGKSHFESIIKGSQGIVNKEDKMVHIEQNIHGNDNKVNSPSNQSGRDMFLGPNAHVENKTYITPPTNAQMGNLIERANQLSDKIIEELYNRGWFTRHGKSSPYKFFQDPIQTWPETPTEQLAHSASLSGYFSHFYLGKVVVIRNEFAKFHIKNDRFDLELSAAGLSEDATGMLNEGNPVSMGILQSRLNPQSIEAYANYLKDLSVQARKTH
jgi:hypothetical protein